MSEFAQNPEIPDGLWQRQFDPAHDFPKTDPAIKVALCTTPRCGSHFLGHQLHATRAFGYPLEYLNPGNWDVWTQRAGNMNTLDFIKSVRTGPNGVFAIKLHHEHLSDFLREEPEPLTYKFIHLCRRDLIKQAISFARAQQTGAWISDMPETAPARYDRALIAAKVDAISRGNADWQSFLRSVGINPLQLYYEDIVADEPAAVAQIADYLDVDIGRVDAATPSFSPQKQKKTYQEDWGAKFAADNRAALASGRAVPGVVQGGRPAAVSPRLKKMAKRLMGKAAT
ncbi:Stf0 family sulfotransferase [Yoonia sp. R2-816]|uniref:Stf0 family sulfotransferase n=1 Tax=Yoonia sp. R2-816 TaxID=3342638 RepID=UPI00372C6FB8